MDRDRFAGIACSVARSAGVVADPWAMLLLRDLFLGLSRYDEFRRDLGVATNVLADRLDRLVEAGLVAREAYQEAPVRHEYRLTDSGRDLYGVIIAVMAWGDRHLAPDGPPMRLVHDTCGRTTVPVVACANCGEELTDGTVTVRPGPGGRRAPGTAVVAERLTSSVAS